MRIKLTKPKKPRIQRKYKPVAYTPEGKPIYGYNSKGHAVCYRKLPKKDGGKGGHCMSTACMDNGRCNLHGGKCISGPMVNTYKDGTYSKYRTFPNGTAERIREIISNPKYLSLAEDIAFYDTLVEDAGAELAGLDKANVGRLLNLVEQLEEALEDDDDKKLKKWLVKLIIEVRQCLLRYDKLQNLKDVHEMRRKLSETEANIMQKQDVQIPATRAVAIFDRQGEIFIEEVERWVPDAAIRRNLLLSVGERMQKLLPGAAPSQPMPLGDTNDARRDSHRSAVSADDPTWDISDERGR